MTCAKVDVIANLFMPNGNHYHGENSCKKPQHDCPRRAGEGYAKCVGVCLQMDHAESAAIRAALANGETNFEGAELYVDAHRLSCEACAALIVAVGIRKVIYFIDRKSVKNISPTRELATPTRCPMF